MNSYEWARVQIISPQEISFSSNNSKNAHTKSLPLALAESLPRDRGKHVKNSKQTGRAPLQTVAERRKRRGRGGRKGSLAFLCEHSDDGQSLHVGIPSRPLTIDR